MALSGDAIWIAPSGSAAPVRVPAYVALGTDNGRVLAVGAEAESMCGREPGRISVVRLNDPGLARDDGHALTEALRYVLRRHGGRAVFGPRVVFVVETGLRYAARAALVAAGAREVLLLEPPMAAAIGIGLKVEEPVPRAVLVLDRHTCSFAVISLAGVIAGFSATQGLGRLLEDLALHTLATRGIALDGERLHTAVVRSGLVGTDAIGWEAWLDEVAIGRSAATLLAEPDVRRVSEPFRHWLAWQHRRAFDALPPPKRLEAETVDVHLTGPYARASGLAELVGAALHRRVVVPPNADTCLVQGAREVLKDVSFLLAYVGRQQRRGR